MDDDNNYIKKYLKRWMKIITSKIFKGIGGNNYIKNIKDNINVNLRQYCK